MTRESATIDAPAAGAASAGEGGLVDASALRLDRFPTRDVLGVPVKAMTMGEVVAACDEAIRRRARLLIGVVNAAKIVHMRSDRALDWSVRSADAILADGMAVVWAARLTGGRLPERVAGIDLMMELLRLGQQRGYRIYNLGATQEVLDKVNSEMRTRFPGVTIAGSHHGYFAREDEERVARDIAAARPDILFVAMTSPKKEEFQARWAHLITAPICHGVGGSFDVLAGKVRRAPAAWQRLGMEWLYRVLQEPGRLWRRYLATNTRFCLLLAGAMLRRLFGWGASGRRREHAAPDA